LIVVVLNICGWRGPINSAYTTPSFTHQVSHNIREYSRKICCQQFDMRVRELEWVWECLRKSVWEPRSLSKMINLENSMHLSKLTKIVNYDNLSMQTIAQLVAWEHHEWRTK